MDINGVRYAVDIKNDNQYALTFDQGRLKSISAYNSAGVNLSLRNVVPEMIDDACLPNGTRPFYKFSIDAGGYVYGRSITYYAELQLPFHHPNGANVARDPEGAHKKALQFAQAPADEQRQIFEKNIARLNALLKPHKSRKPSP